MLKAKIISGNPDILGQELEKFLSENDDIMIVETIQSQSATTIPAPTIITPGAKQGPQIFLNITMTLFYREMEKAKQEKKETP